MYYLRLTLLPLSYSILAQQSGNLTFQDQGIHNVDLTNRSCVISVNLHVCLFYLIFVRLDNSTKRVGLVQSGPHHHFIEN